jgi:hypothetical protein
MFCDFHALKPFGTFFTDYIVHGIPQRQKRKAGGQTNHGVYLLCSVLVLLFFALCVMPEGLTSSAGC